MSASPFIVGGPTPALAAFVAVVPSDTAQQGTPFRSLLCAVGGTVSMLDSQGNTATLTLTAGVAYALPPIVRVNVTGTTATGLVGMA